MNTNLFKALLLTVAIGTVWATACGGEASTAPKTSEPSATATTTSARADSNKALVARYFDEVWTRKNLDAIDKFVAPNLVNHAAINEAQGAAGLKTINTKLLKAFPDMTMQVLNVATDGDEIVIVRATAEGTHTGDLDFKTPLPATNKHMKVDQVHTFRVKDGRIVETWVVMDKFEFLSQLGMLPTPH
jgi:predicted ester cyclase